MTESPPPVMLTWCGPTAAVAGAFTEIAKLPAPSAVGVASVTAGLSHVTVIAAPGGNRVPATVNDPPGSTTMTVAPSAGRSKSMTITEPSTGANGNPERGSMSTMIDVPGAGSSTTTVPGAKRGHRRPLYDGVSDTA